MPIQSDTSTVSTNAHDPANEPAYRAAAERLAGEFAELPDADLDSVNLEIPSMVSDFFGTWPRFQEMLPELEAVPQIDMARVRKLHDYALALFHWQASAAYATSGSSELPAMLDKGIAIRDRTLTDLKALAGHGHLDPALLANFGGPAAYRKVAQDLSSLANLVHEHWSSIQGRSLITLEAIDEAGKLGQAMSEAVGLRDKTPTSKAFAAQQKVKAYTLFLRSYDEARRGLIFLRWHEGDADKILPSLYAKGRAPKRSQDETPASDSIAAAPTPTTPGRAATPVNSPLLGGSAATTAPGAPSPFTQG